MQTPVIVRAVPPRLPWVEAVVRQCPRAVVTVDPLWGKPETDGLSRSLAAFLRAAALAGDGPAVHVEDDLILTRDFGAKLEAAVEVRPDRVIQFFSLRKKDAELGSRWMNGDTFLMGQCFYLPPGYSRLVADYVPRWCAAHPEHPGGWELALADWLRRRKESYWMHVPSLVQHRQVKSSIDPRRSTKRLSPSFVDPEA